jgi:hypothetical protein
VRGTGGARRNGLASCSDSPLPHPREMLCPVCERSLAPGACAQVGVRFDKAVPAGSSLGGACEDGHGLICSAAHLETLSLCGAATAAVVDALEAAIRTLQVKPPPSPNPWRTSRLTRFPAPRRPRSHSRSQLRVRSTTLIVTASPCLILTLILTPPPPSSSARREAGGGGTQWPHQGQGAQ